MRWLEKGSGHRLRGSYMPPENSGLTDTSTLTISDVREKLPGRARNLAEKGWLVLEIVVEEEGPEPPPELQSWLAVSGPVDAEELASYVMLHRPNTTSWTSGRTLPPSPNWKLRRAMLGLKVDTRIHALEAV